MRQTRVSSCFLSLIVWGITSNLGVCLYWGEYQESKHLMTSSTAGIDSTHSHVFNEGNPLAEKNTARAVALTAVMMEGLTVLHTL